NVDDVVVPDLVDRTRFLHEALDHLGILRERGVEHLDGDLLADHRVHTGVDRAHATFGHEPGDLVLTHAGADFESHGSNHLLQCGVYPNRRPGSRHQKRAVLRTVQEVPGIRSATLRTRAHGRPIYHGPGAAPNAVDKLGQGGVNSRYMDTIVTFPRRGS